MRLAIRVLLAVATATLLTAAPLLAQSSRGYITGLGGFATSPDKTSGDFLGELGVNVVPHVSVFGDLGRFHDLQPSDAQPAVDNALALSNAQGFSVIGTPRVPATYYLGGVKVEVPTHSRILPYVLGGVGAAHLTPTAKFTFSSGTLPDGTTPTVGDDVTSELTTTGDLTLPPSSNAFMYTFGGGVDIPVARHFMVDAGYRASRVQADTPLTAHGATFGFGYRF